MITLYWWQLVWIILLGAWAGLLAAWAVWLWRRKRELKDDFAAEVRFMKQRGEHVAAINMVRSVKGLSVKDAAEWIRRNAP